MLIAIDIGNSKIKAGLFENNKLLDFFSFVDTADVLKFLKFRPKDNVAISSVVPGKTKIIADKISELKGVYPFIISKDIKTNLTITYKTPETLGTDRLCSAEGAYFLFKYSEEKYENDCYILSIDLGTATTINIIEHPAKLTGGLIAPGIDMMFESLEQKTAQLPLLNVSEFISIIGEDTNSSIASGVITSAAGMIERVINYLRKERMADKIFIYITGGNAEKLIPFFNFNYVYEKGLTLYGINSLYNLNNKNIS